MSAPKLPLPRQQFAPIVNPTTPESRYWKNFSNPIVIKDFGAVNDICFAPDNSGMFAVTDSTKINIFSSQTMTSTSAISRFKDTVTSIDIRSDSKLIGGGDKSGVIQIFNAASKSVVRTVSSHSLAVNSFKFSPHSLRKYLSASDDKRVFIYDLSENTPTCKIDAHDDYVRAALFHDTDPNLVISGSLDSYVRIFDLRCPSSQRLIFEFNHDNPVESVCCFSRGYSILSAGGPFLRSWDLVAGKQLANNSLTSMGKNFSSILKTHSEDRILVSSLDGLVRIIHPIEWKIVHAIKYSSPILSMSMSPDNTILAVGMSNGLLSIRKKGQRGSESVTKHDSKSKDPVLGNKEGPKIVEEERRRKLKPFETSIYDYKFGDALDMSIASHDPLDALSVIKELLARNSLDKALSHRDEASIEPIIQYFVKYVTDPRYFIILHDAIEEFCKIYSKSASDNTVLSDLLLKLRMRVESEIKNSEQAQELLGMLESIT